MRKRILFIHNHLVCGGVEKVLITMFNRFDYSRYDVSLLLIYKCGEFLKDLPGEVKLIYLYPNKLSFLEKINYNLLSRFGSDLGYRFFINYKTKKYDTIISFYGGYPLKYHSYIAKKAQNNISWVHTDMINNHHTISRFFTKKQENYAYTSMDKIMFVSNDAKKQFESLYPDIVKTKEVILNPIEKDLIAQYRKEYKKYMKDRCFNIVSVGRLSPEKGFDRLVRLAKRLKGESCIFKINIIGDGDSFKDLEKSIIENDVVDNVFLLGFVNSPYEEMSKADLLISSSVAEGFSLVVAEAFCLGLPVVATKTTGPIELIDNDKYGILVDHDDESIYQAVKKMMNDDSLREYYHRKSFERAETLDIEKVMNQVYSIL